jgi:oligoendopeptidase F
VERARALGVPPDSVEPWLVRVLSAWREAQPDTLLEPWDWYHYTGAASRHLEARVPKERLLALNRDWYRRLGADLGSLQVTFDLEPRPGKYPVAYTTFGARPFAAGGAWNPGAPYISASYRIGGLDNLVELLHETGHAIHIAGIRTRPAYADWPDSDTFTEAVADLASHDAYEPRWQVSVLGDSVPLAEGLRGKYGGVVLDMAWALFEIRMFRDPGQDPNLVWADVTSRYLQIRPHPEWSWWAMRGQLIESPGYMLNYALGGVLTAALRGRIAAERGDWLGGDAGWYPWVRGQLFQYGASRPAAAVVREFLGGPLTPAAILADLARGKD